MWHDVERKLMICALALLRSRQSNRHDVFVAYFGFRVNSTSTVTMRYKYVGALSVPNVIVLHWLCFEHFVGLGDFDPWMTVSWQRSRGLLEFDRAICFQDWAGRWPVVRFCCGSI